MQGRLSGKVCIVTGATSGIGRATALLFARQGAHVLAAGRREAELAALAREAATILPCATDVRVEEEVRALVDLALDRFGKLDAAVNAAGATFRGGLTHELDEQDFRAWIDGYLVSSFLCAKHQLRGLLETRAGEPHDGSIINVGTFVGYTRALAGCAGYAAAKTGLIGLTRTIAAEYAPRGIRANLLIVGGVDTPMFHAQNQTAESRSFAARLHAMERIAKPEEIAHAALHLASSESSFTTGSLLSVDGGVSLL